MCRSRMGAARENSWDSRASRLRIRCADVNVDADGSSRRMALAIGETAAPGYTYINNLYHDFDWVDNYLSKVTGKSAHNCNNF